MGATIATDMDVVDFPMSVDGFQPFPEIGRERGGMFMQRLLAVGAEYGHQTLVHEAVEHAVSADGFKRNTHLMETRDNADGGVRVNC